jgi:hypothetical protein
MASMPRYLVCTRRPVIDRAPTALESVTSFPGVRVLIGNNPNAVTIEAEVQIAERLRAQLLSTHSVEEEIRRKLT